jgi:hypothetical protein
MLSVNVRFRSIRKNALYWTIISGMDPAIERVPLDETNTAASTEKPCVTHEKRALFIGNMRVFLPMDMG